MHDKIQRFSLRKLSVGLVSIMVGACIFSVNGKTVKADVTSDQTTQKADVQGQTTTTQPQSNDVQSKKKQTSSEQNSVADQSQKNLLDDLGKQKASTENNQVEDKNQENGLVDQINYKLTNNTSTDNKKDLGQNLTVPDETKQVPTAKSDAEKSIVSSSSTQQVSNQSNNHAEDNSQSQPQNEQKLDLTKNSKKFAKKVLATNLIETNSSPMTNGGFDSSWGTLNVNDWQGSVQGDYYQLTDYTGNANHVIVPNEADFEKAGISTSGKQVGVTSDLMYRIFAYKATATDATVAFSKTDNKMVKAINANWTYTWNSQANNRGAKLSRFDGTNLDVSNVTDMSYMFCENQISDLSPLAKWNVNNVTDMSYMFLKNQISDLSPLAKWHIDHVANMSMMFADNQISDLSPLANWNVNNVTNMNSIFESNQISDLSSLAKWDVSNVTDITQMFQGNQISDLSPLTNWNTSKVDDMGGMFKGNLISNLSPLANWHIDHVTHMGYIFASNPISDLSPLANWHTSKVDAMDGMFENCSNLSDISPLANWDTSNVTDMTNMFADTPLKKVKLTNWDFSHIDTSYVSIFPDTNFEATLSDKTSKSLLDISSQLSDPAKNILKVIDSAPIVDGVPDVRGEIQEGLDSIKQAKDDYQQELAYYKQKIDHYKKELADPNVDATAKENSQDELKQAEQKYQYYLTGDGKKEYDEQLQNLQGELEQYKQGLQQEINQYKLKAKYPLISVFGNHSKITTHNHDLLAYLVGKLPVKSDPATRTIEITFPDGTKKKISQSVGYGKYAISGTADMATHKLDMAMPYELSKWELIKKEDGSYDLVKAHVDNNGIAIFDAVQLPKIPGYTVHIKPVLLNPNMRLFAVSFMAIPQVTPDVTQKVKPEPAKPAPIETQIPVETYDSLSNSALTTNDSIPQVTPDVTQKVKPEPAKPALIETQVPVETHDSLNNSTLTTNDSIPDTIMINTVVPEDLTWQIDNKNLNNNVPYHLTNTIYKLRLPRFSNYELHLVKRGTTKNSISFVYTNKSTQLNYVFNLKIQGNKYYLTVDKIDRVNRKILPIKTYNVISYQDLLDIVDKYFK